MSAPRLSITAPPQQRSKPARLRTMPRASSARASRTLFGTIDAQSYDWLAGPPPPGGAASARLAATHRMEAGSVSALYADAGNVHSFAARSPAAVFDVLVPGYCYGPPPIDTPQLQFPSCILARRIAQGRHHPLTPLCTLFHVHAYLPRQLGPDHPAHTHISRFTLLYMSLPALRS